MSRIYDFALPAPVNSSRLIQATGTRAKLIAATWGPLQVRTDRGEIFDLLPGQGFETRDGQPFRELWIYNATGVATVGSLFVGDDRFIDDRVTGSVEIVDGERNKVAAGVCFSGVAQLAGGTAGPQLQLWNVSTTRNIFVNAVTLGGSAADSWGLKTCTNALNTVAPNTCFSHDTSGANAVAGQLRQDNAGQVLLGERTLRIGYLQASADRVVILPKPVMVRPGTGLVVYANGVGTTLRAAFEFEEWPT